MSHHLRRVRARTPPPPSSPAPPPPPPPPPPRRARAARGARTAPTPPPRRRTRAGRGGGSRARARARRARPRRSARGVGGTTRARTRRRRAGTGLGGGDPELGRGEAPRGADEGGGGPVENEPVPENDAESAGVTAARGRAARFLTAALRAHASRPPASLPAHELFCVSERSTAAPVGACKAAPRLALEQTPASPREGLRARAVLATAGRARARRARARRTGSCRTSATPRTCTSGSGGSASCTRGARWRRASGGGARGEAREGGGRRGGGGASDEKGGKNARGGGGGDRAGAKGTRALVKNRRAELQARFTRAVAELEFLGVARRGEAAEGRVHARARRSPWTSSWRRGDRGGKGGEEGARRDETFLECHEETRNTPPVAIARRAARWFANERRFVGRPRNASRRRAERAPPASRSARRLSVPTSAAAAGGRRRGERDFFSFLMVPSLRGAGRPANDGDDRGRRARPRREERRPRDDRRGATGRERGLDPPDGRVRGARFSPPSPPADGNGRDERRMRSRARLPEFSDATRRWGAGEEARGRGEDVEFVRASMVLSRFGGDYLSPLEVVCARRRPDLGRGGRPRSRRRI